MDTTNAVYLDEHGAVLGALSIGRMNELKIAEADRISKIKSRRDWYNGTQYEGRNIQRAEEMQCKPEDLAEHEKLHAYSTQISESVDFIAAQMAAGFQLVTEDQKVRDLVVEAMSASPGFAGGDNADDISLTNPLREALISQDVPVWVRWDSVEEHGWFDLYSSENVWMVFDEDDPTKLVRVIVREDRWDRDPMTGEETKRTRNREWFISSGTCWLGTRWQEQEEWMHIEDLKVPFIPWVNLRAKRKRLVDRRGESLISDQAIAGASRYNAVEQLSYLIARYNSHGNLAVIGDGATLKAQMEERIDKDIADILTFPGGTAIQMITLPTDPQMIEHQRSVLLDTLYGCFGSSRQDTETLNGMGNVTGYALEILNRRTDSTFSELQKNFIGDLRRMAMLLLDVTAYRQNEQEDLSESPYDEEMPWVAKPDADLDSLQEEARYALILDQSGIDPMAVFPKRGLKISLGSAYIVDRAMIRADYTGGLISRKEALRQYGYHEDDIKKIMAEIDEEEPAEPEATMSSAARQASRSAISAGGTGDVTRGEA